MRLMVLNPNTHDPMTRDMEEQATRYARADVTVTAYSAPFGAESIEGSYEEAIAVAAMLDVIKRHAHAYDGVIIACWGDPGLYAAREISPVPVVGIGEASMMMACLVAHKFSIVVHLPRVVPILEHAVLLHGFSSRCASIRATSISILDGERDRERAQAAIIAAGKDAVANDGAEAICLGCGGWTAFDRVATEAIGVPVLDGIACAVKMMEGLLDYGLTTSRAGAFMAPESKVFSGMPSAAAAATQE